jgi:hypothetical protein
MQSVWSMHSICNSEQTSYIYIYINLSNYVKDIPSWEADSYSDDQEVRRLWNNEFSLLYFEEPTNVQNPEAGEFSPRQLFLLM